jgi:hypothetical protein
MQQRERYVEPTSEARPLIKTVRLEFQCEAVIQKRWYPLVPTARFVTIPLLNLNAEIVMFDLGKARIESVDFKWDCKVSIIAAQAIAICSTSSKALLIRH